LSLKNIRIGLHRMKRNNPITVTPAQAGMTF